MFKLENNLFLEVQEKDTDNYQKQLLNCKFLNKKYCQRLLGEHGHTLNDYYGSAKEEYSEDSFLIQDLLNWLGY